jgi:hypothetical protein
MLKKMQFISMLFLYLTQCVLVVYYVSGQHIVPIFKAQAVKTT